MWWSLEKCWWYLSHTCTHVFRYRLHFERESREEIERRKREAKAIPIIPVSEVRIKMIRVKMITCTTRCVYN